LRVVVIVYIFVSMDYSLGADAEELRQRLRRLIAEEIPADFRA
jgi:hypothetical protein